MGKEMMDVMKEMTPVGLKFPDNEEEMEYSFAIEYNGPPLSYELPRAIPVDMKSIPIASVVSLNNFSNELSLPIVQPLADCDTMEKKISREMILGSDCVVSPTSVIAFEEGSRVSPECELSGECSSSLSGYEQCFELSDVVDRSVELGSCNDCNCSGIRTDDDEHSDELSDESASSSQVLSTDISCEDEAECDSELQEHAGRPSNVTFREDDSSSSIFDGASSIESEHSHVPKEPEHKVQKRLCYRCSKVSRFGEKEACLVCNAKYCANCVLIAMGSMPEGRKCLSCIGYPIDESNRRNLGKFSRMLKRKLNELEIRQLMKVEKFCEKNQLQAEHVYVNGQKLSQEELIKLRSCPRPPTKLKPGKYWYDKVSGLWGKEGQKPCKFISPHLNVGGDIMNNASNGNANVKINNREITKVELRLLQLAGVQCAGNPHFWLDECGFYQEEGQKLPKGNLWNKTGIKVLCAALSLPIPSSKIVNPSAEEVNILLSGAIPEYLKERALQKLLLVGYDGSGTSTIFKQAKMLYKAEPFSEHELQDIKFIIQRNVYTYLCILLEGRERFEEESLAQMKRTHQPDFVATDFAVEENDRSIYSIGTRLKAFSDWLLKVMVSGNLDAIFPAASREYAPLVEELWKNTAIQATYDRRSELKMLPSAASYFLERADDISRRDYEPSHMDILYSEGITSSNGITSMDFKFQQPLQQGNVDAAELHDPLLRYQLIRVDARGLGEHCKWVEMFEDIRMVIFSVALSDYDQFCDDGSGAPTNKILASRKLFENIVTHPTFEGMDFLLILNKYDQLEEKIVCVPLSKCNWFTDFNLLLSNHHVDNSNNTSYIASPAEQASHYIAVKFKKLFLSLTGRKLYVSVANALKRDNIDGAFKFAREILKWDEERDTVNVDYPSYSNTEAVSSP